MKEGEPTSVEQTTQNSLSNSIASFLKKTNNISTTSAHVDTLKQEISHLESTNRDIRASSVSRATSVSRTFDFGTSPSPGFRASSVAREGMSFNSNYRTGYGQFDVSSRDPYYGNISRTSMGRYQRESSLPPSIGAIKTRALTVASPALGALPENRTVLSPRGSQRESSVVRKTAAEDKKRLNGHFRTLEEECNWILSGREQLPPDYGRADLNEDDEDENTLDDVSADELSEMTAELGKDTPTVKSKSKESSKPKEQQRLKASLQQSRDLMSLSVRNGIASTPTFSRYDRAYSVGPEMNGSFYDDPSDVENSVMRSKYERAMYELEKTKRQLLQQHEDGQEQLICLKKQMEKKLNEAYEDVDEHRREAARWKKKYQAAQGEMNETQLMLEENNSRGNLLESKLKKLDVELSQLSEERMRMEFEIDSLNKDLEAARLQKVNLLDEMKDLRTSLDSKDEKILAMQRELEEVSLNTEKEDELKKVRRQKLDLEARLKDQEAEIEDLSGKCQMLEASRTKAEMQITTMQKDYRRDLDTKSEEVDSIKSSSNKKIKILEQQLEEEHEERLMFMREKHDLESRISVLQDALQKSVDEEQVVKMKKELRRTKALLKDAQTMLEKGQGEGPSANKAIQRQLKNQLDDAEFAKNAALKAKQSLEHELKETQHQVDELKFSKQESETKLQKIIRDQADLEHQLEECEEEIQNVLKKYKLSVATVSKSQNTIRQQQSKIQELENEKKRLEDSLAELTNKANTHKEVVQDTEEVLRLELRIKELETKLDLELATNSRQESVVNRLKDNIEKHEKECKALEAKEAAAQDQIRKLSKQILDLKETISGQEGREAEAAKKRSDLERELELVNIDANSLRSELQVSSKRIEDLQKALMETEDGESDEEMSVFMDHHRRAMSVQRGRESMARDSAIRDVIARGESLLRETSTREIRAQSLLRDVRSGSSVARETRAMSLAPRIDYRSSSITREINSMTRELNKMDNPTPTSPLVDDPLSKSLKDPMMEVIKEVKEVNPTNDAVKFEVIPE